MDIEQRRRISTELFCELDNEQLSIALVIMEIMKNGDHISSIAVSPGREKVHTPTVLLDKESNTAKEFSSLEIEEKMTEAR